MIAGRDDLAEPLVEAIGRELASLGAPQPVDTLYFGGGTPTQLATRWFDQLCDAATTWHPLAAGGEWTVEANPDGLDAQRLAAFAEWGVTRISLGGQSFLPKKLRILERTHAPRQVVAAATAAKQLGLQTSVDLIFGVPGETFEDWRTDLQRLIDLAPDHASTYGLTFEKGTPFWARRRRGALVEAAEELQRAMYIEAMERLTEAGYEHYEVSNFAQPGRRSRHNQAYWSGTGYFAAGPGAARYVDHVRETNHRSTTTYLKRMARGMSPVAEREVLSPEARARERLIFGLRLLEGVDESQFAAETGFHFTALAGGAIGRFIDAGWMQKEGERLRLTREGLLVSDCLWPDLV